MERPECGRDKKDGIVTKQERDTRENVKDHEWPRRPRVGGRAECSESPQHAEKERGFEPAQCPERDGGRDGRKRSEEPDFDLSGRRVVNLDGLVNSWNFYNVQRRDMCSYWRTEGVRYLVDEFDLDRELAAASAVFRIDVSPCATQLYRVWIGPQSASNPVAHAEAFELR